MPVTHQERNIERNACNAIKARWPRWLCQKSHDTGFPDRQILIGGGLHFWIEFKTPIGRLSNQQKAIVELLTEMGEKVYVCTSTVEALAAAQKAVVALSPSDPVGPSLEGKSTAPADDEARRR